MGTGPAEFRHATPRDCCSQIAKTLTTTTAEPESRSVSKIDIVQIDGTRSSQWEAFLDDAKDDSHSTLYHRTAWDDVWNAYGLRAVRFAAVEGARVVGVLPVVHQKSLLFGNRLVSLPWFDAAGVIAPSDAIRDALIHAACEHARGVGATAVHLRQYKPYEGSFSARTDKVLMRLALPNDSATLWDSFSPKVRNQVRKAEKSGLQVQVGGQEHLDALFDVYSANMRDLGSPSHSRRFLAAVLEAFGPQTRIFRISLDGETVGAGMTLSDGGTMEIPWASSLRRYNALCVNHQLYWSILRHACDAGLEWFHFGRSTVDSGTYRFKRQWGAEPHTLYWYDVDSHSGEANNAERSEESYGLGRRMWARLPVCISRWLGPRIIRHVA